MTTSSISGTHTPSAAAARTGLLHHAAALTGALFVAEALLSVVVDSHVGYHALNTVLNAALLVACLAITRRGSGQVGRAGVVGGWLTASMALLAVVGGLWAVLVEGLTSAEVPGWVDGIAHTAVLASLLFLVAVGLGLRRVTRAAGYVIAGAAACCVTMVLVGLDQPEAFLAPEAVLGLGWLMTSRAWPHAGDAARP